VPLLNDTTKGASAERGYFVILSEKVGELGRLVETSEQSIAKRGKNVDPAPALNWRRSKPGISVLYEWRMSVPSSRGD
jgi:hypothetical protein